MSKSKLIGIVVALLVVLGLVVYGVFFTGKGGNGDAMEESNVAAVVNGVDILKSTYEAQLATSITNFKGQGVDVENPEIKKQIETQVLNDLINNEIVNQEIAKAGIKPTAEEIEAQYQALVTQAGTPEAFQEQLTSANLTEAQLRENITNQLTIQAYLKSNVDVTGITATDEEIQALYDQAKATQTDLPPLEEVKDQVSAQVIATKQQTAVNAFVQSLRDKATVEILLVTDTASTTPETTE
ncbi:hypothetical protein COW81_01300 [Candidatus Campbellbacteria bacterium CG22_combo_CG10-13_8_21_14_all_36_13]|uniref:Peptidylprolyl isomerase n=1 Tax=Candidatus Campbellbacteria bacterium CG22_combo_CG10-13_8_21_14_all_36_13 TaxID=1974529 RepID=A0A2H0DYJ0_9BACT|nr:MAG: hypothetical protein COW81_01300 [Candidatus Campbellbacteria bacterium CG22_combo_CG10-13_8_21_14_all_36_13]